ncbi:MAG: hypothetical protein U0228_00050 [Myxococcaceae bacterium]
MFYKPSGKAPVDGLLMGLVVGGLCAVPLAAIYAYAITYIPIIGVVTFILTGGFALLVAVAASTPMHSRKVRGPLPASLVGAFAGLISLWAMWIFWLYALLHREEGAGQDVGLLDLAINPFATWKLIELVNETGSWSLKGATPTGAILWIIWGCEAAILVGLPMWLTASNASDPFCEKCDTWCEQKLGFFITEPVERKQLEDWLRAGRLDQLAGTPAPTNASTFQSTVAVRCGCGETSTVSVIETRPDNKGNAQTNDLVRNVLLPRDGISTLLRLREERAKKFGVESVAVVATVTTEPPAPT